MEHRYPRWLTYLILVFPLVFGGFYIYGFKTQPVNDPESAGTVLLGVLVAGVSAFCLFGALYAHRYRIEVGDDSVTFTGAFRTKMVPLSRIAQVMTVSTPRGGTGSFLLDKDDGVLGKIDGSLAGYDFVLADLGQKLRPYQATFYKCGTWGSWEMQVAGDTHWVPSAPPRLARTNGRHQAIILVVGFSLIAIFIAIATSIEHVSFFEWLGH